MTQKNVPRAWQQLKNTGGQCSMSNLVSNLRSIVFLAFVEGQSGGIFG